MQKVVFSIIKLGKYDNKKMTGIRYINQTDLITFRKDKDGNCYKRIYDDCLKYCHKIIGKDNEFKGQYYEYQEVEFETRTSSGQFAGYGRNEIEVNYNIWFKLID